MIAESSAPKARLGKDANIVATRPKDKFRTFRLLGHAQHLLIESEVKSKAGNVHRTRLCHAVRSHQAESISLRISADDSRKAASLAGLQTCGSVWACPVCAKRIAMQRGKEVSHAIDRMTASGFLPIMFTNTASHQKDTPLAQFKNSFKAAHRYFVQSRRWRDLKKVFGIVHSIKAVEVTWSKRNGFHYHQHSIVFAKADNLEKITDLGITVWVEMCKDLWMEALKRNGLFGERDIAFDVRLDAGIKKDYLAKLGMEDETANLDYELTASGSKDKGGLKIWSVLERDWQGTEELASVYLEYVRAMTGDNWITWSHGLKELCGINELDDEQAAEVSSADEQAMIPLLEISDEQYLPVRKFRAYGDLLQLAAATRNEAAVTEFLQELATDWNNSGAGKERDRLEAQYKALKDRWEWMRKHWNRKGQHPPENHEFWQVLKQWQELEKKLRT